MPCAQLQPTGGECKLYLDKVTCEARASTMLPVSCSG